MRQRRAMPRRRCEPQGPSDRRQAKHASVIIATFNRRQLLGQVLQALIRQTVPHDDFEVVVVDDGSADGTLDWLAQQRFPFQLHAIRQVNTGPSGARNAGIAAASGDIIIFLDDDLVPTPDLVREHLQSHAAEERVVVLGPAVSLPYYRQPWIAWQQATFERAYRAMALGRIKPTFRHCWSGNCSAPRRDIVAVGGFDTRLPCNEDVELGQRLMECGLRFRFNPAAKGYHHSARSFEAWARTHSIYGRLDAEIFSRSGEAAMYRLLADGWRARHWLTRGLVRWAAAQPSRSAAARLALRCCIRMGTLAPMSAFSRAACAAFANLLYWHGVTTALDRDASLFNELEAMR